MSTASAHPAQKRLIPAAQAVYLEGPKSRGYELLFAWRVFKQFIKGFRTLHFAGPCITVFGSARFSEEHPYYQQARTFGKFLTSTATATDDLDGEATTEDDQEIQFFKVLNHTTSAADTKTLTVSLAKADTTNASDAGSLRSQNYCDFTYFAEDYVGQSRTF